MKQTKFIVSVAAVLAALVTNTTVWAKEVPRPKWMQPRGYKPEAVPEDPSGWKLGLTLTSPFSAGWGVAYLFPMAGFTLKGGLDWGITTEKGVTAFGFQDWRLYGGTVYNLVAGQHSGPYVEVGLDVCRSHGGILNYVNWPVVPHIGFGTVVKQSTDTHWDLNFSATGNGLVTLQGGVIFRQAPPRPGTEDEDGNEN